MNMLMLAGIDLSGIFCLAAIPCLIIAIMAYSKGFFYGMWLCFVVFMAFMLVGIELETDEDGIPKNFITNSSETKFIKEYDYFPRYESGCIYRQGASLIVIYGLDIPIPASINGHEVYIPEEELRKVDGVIVMRSTGRPPIADDYYLYDKKRRHVDVLKEFGGGNDGKGDGIPKWVYHRTAPLLIFGIGGSPCLLLMLGSTIFFGNRSKG